MNKSSLKYSLKYVSSHFQVQSLIGHSYKNLFGGAKDRYFRALDQMVADSDFVCHTEQLAQALAKNGNDVYRFAQQFI